MSTTAENNKAMVPAEEPEKLDLRSFDITDEKRAELLALFPEARTEGGKIDFERLKLALGEAVDVGKERYGMNWPGKADCFRTIQTPSVGTLRPVPEESVNFDTTENLIIEGDNLEVLKLLQKPYLGKIKMIYIDPPYNTGNDFIYPDNYTESLETYLEYTGQSDAEGKKFGTNTDSDGRFHSKWLNMMYPRLYLAKNLLKNDGAIFVSIGDDELSNLRTLMNTIFGEENFVGTFVWKRRVSSSLADRLVSTDHEYVVAFQKESFVSLGIPKQFDGYSNPDNDPRGPWKADNLTVGMNREQRPNQYYPIENPLTGKSYPANPNRVWSYIKSSMDKLIAEGRIIFPEDDSKRPLLKRFQNELKTDVNPVSTWLDQVGLNSEGTRELQNLLNENAAIYPKPTSLLRTLIEGATNGDDLVLDFFAGSGTTAQAVLGLNQQDGGNRRFILVQLPEPTGREDFNTISEITKERVRRVIKKISEDASTKLVLKDNKLDLGFRVFKLAESNFTSWNAEGPKDPTSLATQLNLHIDHIRQQRTDDDILYELLLKSGFPLTTPVEKKTVEGKTIYSVASGALVICLDRALTLELIRAIADMKPERVVCLDEGFAGNDQLKTNAVQTFKTKGITSFKTV